MIINDLDNPGNNEPGKLLMSAGYTVERLRAFREHFLKSNIPSVDAFIQEWHEEWEREGKATIAAILLYTEAQSRNRLFSDPDWYQSLMLAIKDHPTLCNDSLAIITFNYDRSLEYYLCGSLPMAKKIERALLEERIQALEILHFYGSLGCIWKERLEGIEYGTVSDQRLHSAAASIHLVGRSVIAREASERAQALCRDAEVIAFLGFAYHPENMQALGFERLLAEREGHLPELRLLGYGMSDVAHARANAHLSGFPQYWHHLVIREYLDHVDLFA